MTLCYCGCGVEFSNCCEPCLNGITEATSPESLMRSRYVAFVTENVDYIKKTMRGNALKDFSREETLAFSQTAQWQRLQVIATGVDAESGKNFVEFNAFYRLNGIDKLMYELSYFSQHEARWYYVGAKKMRVVDV